MYWTVCLEGGLKRVNHAAAAVGNNIYSFGGYSSNDESKEFQPLDVHVLNVYTLKWMCLPTSNQYMDRNVPFHRYGHTALAYKDNIYVWGGRNDESSCNVLFCFDTITHKWDAPPVTGVVPGSRDGHSVCLHGDNMYVFGGYEGDMDSFSHDVYMLNLDKLHWSYVVTWGVPPSVRDFHTAVVINDKMYIFGGRSNSEDPLDRNDQVYSSRVLFLDLITKQWHRPYISGNKPLGRRSHSAFVYEGKMYIFGGYNSVVGKHFNDLMFFNPDGNVWKQVKPLGESPCERRRQSCVLIHDKVYLFGGTSPVNEVLLENNDEEELEENLRLRHHDDLYIMDFKPTLRTLCIVIVNKYNLNISILPRTLQNEIRQMTNPSEIASLSDYMSEFNFY